MRGISSEYCAEMPEIRCVCPGDEFRRRSARQHLAYAVGTFSLTRVEFPDRLARGRVRNLHVERQTSREGDLRIEQANGFTRVQADLAENPFGLILESRVDPSADHAGSGAASWIRWSRCFRLGHAVGLQRVRRPS